MLRETVIEKETFSEGQGNEASEAKAQAAR